MTQRGPSGSRDCNRPPARRRAGHAAPEPFYERLINSEMVAEVPLPGLFFVH